MQFCNFLKKLFANFRNSSAAQALPRPPTPYEVDPLSVPTRAEILAALVTIGGPHHLEMGSIPKDKYAMVAKKYKS